MYHHCELEIPRRLWEMIAEAKGEEARMRAILDRLSREELLIFYKECSYAADELEGYIGDYLEDHGEAIPDWICSEAFGWLLSRGERYCVRLCATPSLIHTISRDEVDWNCVFSGFAILVYETKFGEPIPNIFDINGRWPV